MAERRGAEKECPARKEAWELCSLGGDLVSWHNPATPERGWSGRLGVRLAPSGLGSLNKSVSMAPEAGGEG